MRFNHPRFQNGPIVWALFCLFGLGVSGWVMIRYPLGSEGWQAGVALAIIVLIGFAAIEGWWLVSQRELSIEGGTINIRRWSDLMLQRRGQVLPLDSVHAVRLVFAGGKKISVEQAGGRAVRFWAALWPRHEIERLLRELEIRGILTAADW